MAVDTKERVFPAAQPSLRGIEPLQIGLIGPPGGGKTMSAIRLAMGMKRVRKGPVVLIDTEGGRSKKFSPKPGQRPDGKTTFDFHRVDFEPPFRPHDFLTVIKQQLALDPAAIIVDSASEEHEGEGGFLEWHDAIANAPKGTPDYVGGNEWAAWAKPKASRKRLTSGLLRILTPLLFTFRAREKTSQQRNEKGRMEVVNIGWMPVAPLEIVHGLDLTCILPPRAEGVPVWTSEKIGEEFIVKLPFYLAPLVQKGQLNEDIGEALARWAMGEDVPTQRQQGPAAQTNGNTADLKAQIKVLLVEGCPGEPSDKNVQAQKAEALEAAFATRRWADVEKMPAEQLAVGLESLKQHFARLKNLRRLREREEES